MKDRTFSVDEMTRTQCATIRAGFVSGEVWAVTVTGSWSRLNSLRTTMLCWANRSKWVLETTLHRTVLGQDTALTIRNGGPLYVKERKHP